MRTTIVASLMALLVMSAIGCGKTEDPNRPKTFPVTGRVTMNGKPVEGANVTFHPASGSQTSIGVTDADGNYSLSTFSSNDGALPGQYKVSIAKYAASAQAKPTTGPRPGELASGDLDMTRDLDEGGGGAVGEASGPKSLLPEKYANELSSGLIATVGEDPAKNKFDFDLK